MAGTVWLERLLPGSMERVWSCLTKSDRRAKWLGVGEMDLRQGGSVELRFMHADLSPVREPTPERCKAMDGGHVVTLRTWQAKVVSFGPLRMPAKKLGSQCIFRAKVAASLAESFAKNLGRDRRQHGTAEPDIGRVAVCVRPGRWFDGWAGGRSGGGGHGRVGPAPWRRRVDPAGRCASPAQARRAGQAPPRADLAHDRRDAARAHQPLMATRQRHARAGRPSQIVTTRHRPPGADADGRYIETRLCSSVASVTINVAAVNSLLGLGDVANPLSAHSGDGPDDRVGALIARGAGIPNVAPIVAERCTWRETDDSTMGQAGGLQEAGITEASVAGATCFGVGGRGRLAWSSPYLAQDRAAPLPRPGRSRSGMCQPTMRSRYGSPTRSTR